MFKKILVGIDGSAGSFKAFDRALEMAKMSGAELHTITVEELPRNPEVIGELIEEKELKNGVAKRAIMQVQEKADMKGVEVNSSIYAGHEVKTIIELIDAEAFDLLIVGFMGHSALYDRVMGSTCQSLVRMAPCSVLVVK
jgi:nucleotide-binding universal stress UspA family protein